MLQKLDQSQKQFCEAQHGNIRLLAPAGCGKTLSILFRCVYLTEKAKSQRLRFLIVTFTVVAKQELLSRLNEDEKFVSIRDRVEIITLNAWGYRRIRNVAFSSKLISSKEDYHFTMRNLLQPIWKNHEQVKAAIEKNSNIAPKKLMELIDSFKAIGFDHIRHTNYEQFVKQLTELRSQGLTPKIDEILDSLARLGIIGISINRKGEEYAKTGEREIYNSFFRFWRDATQHLIESATFTLEDQKYFAYLDEYQKLDEGKYLSGAAQYDHILVDEFQDINPLDLALLKVITKRNRANITIVGDDDQALFEWRGATPEYILNPNKYFEMDFTTYTLATNYRSPINIVEMSQRLIARNSRRVEKTISSSGTDKASVEIQVTENLNQAMERVYDEINNFIAQGQSPSRVAIIGRKRSQLIPYQIYFASKGVSFCAAEDLQIFMSEAFERILRLITIKNKCHERRRKTEVVEDLLELCNLVKRYPLSKKDKEALRKHLIDTSVSTVLEAVKSLEVYRGSLKGEKTNTEGKISLDMAKAIRSLLVAKTVAESICELGDNFQGLQTDIGKAEDDIFYVDPPFLHLAEYAIRYDDDYIQFIEDVDRAKQQLAYIPPFEYDDKPSSIDELWKRPVHLMTAIRSKGKEFDSVILLDVNDDIWPNKNAQTPDQKEGERRVFYVAFTRAKRRVLMLVSKRLGNREAIPSPYIGEMGLTVI
ncbi:MAG: ATP-dependent helicase [Nostoc sp.]|uniref:ATP-dependent helicase n=1 Tax=Nostoc sp. TaxID=1180 RepID=UPI002FF74B18